MKAPDLFAPREFMPPLAAAALVGESGEFAEEASDGANSLTIGRGAEAPQAAATPPRTGLYGSALARLNSGAR